MKTKLYYKSVCLETDQDNNKLIRKAKKSNTEKIYNYLTIKQFDNFVSPYKTTEKYEYFPYIETTNIPNEDKAIELIHTISMLHIKTSTYQEVNIDKAKQIYEQTKKEIEDLRYYYLNLQDAVEYKQYPTPSEQLFITNASNIYKALNYAEYKIEIWYQEKEKNKLERLVLNHNNLSLEHALFDNKINLISWNNSTKDYPIFDFLKFYKNEFNNLEMISLFKIYNNKFQYSKEEHLLLESLIALPSKPWKKIIWTSQEQPTDAKL